MGYCTYTCNVGLLMGKSFNAKSKDYALQMSQELSRSQKVTRVVSAIKNTDSKYLFTKAAILRGKTKPIF